MLCAPLHRLFSHFLKSASVIVFLLCAVGCNSGGGGDEAPAPSDNTAALEQQIRELLDDAITDTDFTLLITAENGRQFEHSVGSSTAHTVYESASTSKWVTAAAILDLVQEGELSLDDHPQDYIDGWPDTGNVSQIQLRHLLSFSSGLNEEALCQNFPNTPFANCVNNILANNPDAPVPGSEFYYNASHLQVAGLMAINASGLGSWTAVFNAFKTRTGLFDTSVYDLPSTTNPRLAGGMHWTATEYLEFLKAVFEESILTPELIADMESDQMSSATVIYSPTAVLEEDWHYGFGNWMECHAATFNCSETTKVSSPGAYGAYPFIDYENRYYGILARQGALGTFQAGYTLFTEVEPYLREWAELNRL